MRKKFGSRILSLLLAVCMILTVLPMEAFAAVGNDHADEVLVVVENNTYTFEHGYPSPWEGLLLADWVKIDENSTMMSAIVEALNSHGFTQKGAENNFISEIEGVKAGAASPMSGWMGTLNDWFTNAGFGDFSVAKGTLSGGDEIRVMYSVDGGGDLGGSWGNNDKSLKNLQISGGTLDKEFSGDVHEYTLTVPAETETISVTPTAANKNFQVKTFLGDAAYKRTQEIAVNDGDVIEVVCGAPEWPSMNNAPYGTADQVPAEVYTITVEKEAGEPEQPVNPYPGTEEAYWGVRTEAKVYDDFENDIWLQYQQKDLQVGDTANLRPWRVPQIVSDVVGNDVARPVFHFEIVAGDSVSLDTESSDSKAVVTAVKPGTTVVKVTYDALDYKDLHWDAISDVNTGYVVYTVGETGTAKIQCSEDFASWRHYDTIYYTEGTTVPYTFEVSAEGAESVRVTLNGETVQGNNGTYTVNLENRSNIIGIEAKDADGRIRSMYRVIDARFVEVHVENKTNPEAELRAGDTANISLWGITMPVYKLATIYNPCFSSIWGGNSTNIQYENAALGKFEGHCSQWDLATNNDFDVTFDKAGSYTFDSPNGIYCEWWGSPLGADITAEGSGEPNLNAPVLKDNFSKLPSFTVEVAEKEVKPAVYTAYVDGEAYVSGEYNTKVELQADEAQGEFVCWMAGADAENLKPVSTKADYTFYLANDIYLEAVYDEAQEIEASASIVNTLALPAADGKINARFVGQLTLPEGAKLLDAGLVWATNETQELALEKGAKETHIKSINSAYQFSVTINGMPQGRFVRGVAFAKYQLPDGEMGYTAETVVYSAPESRISNET